MWEEVVSLDVSSEISGRSLFSHPTEPLRGSHQTPCPPCCWFCLCNLFTSTHRKVAPSGEMLKVGKHLWGDSFNIGHALAPKGWNPGCSQTNRQRHRITAYWRRSPGAEIASGTTAAQENLNFIWQRCKCEQNSEFKTPVGRPHFPQFYLQDT